MDTPFGPILYLSFLHPFEFRWLPPYLYRPFYLSLLFDLILLDLIPFHFIPFCHWIGPLVDVFDLAKHRTEIRSTLARIKLGAQSSTIRMDFGAHQREVLTRGWGSGHQIRSLDCSFSSGSQLRLSSHLTNFGLSKPHQAYRHSLIQTDLSPRLVTLPPLHSQLSNKDQSRFDWLGSDWTLTALAVLAGLATHTEISRAWKLADAQIPLLTINGSSSDTIDSLQCLLGPKALKSANHWEATLIHLNFLAPLSS